MKALIQKLVETDGPSGYETNLRSLVRSQVEPLADQVWVDNLGNLFARKGKAEANGLKIMLAAHMDEIGLMVTHIDQAGFARFMPLGGVRAQNCPGGRVHFLNGARGVIGVEKLDDPGKGPAIDQLFIDLGASSRDDCPVKVGDVAAFERPFIDLGSRLVSKAMDDRIGVAVLIETLRGLKSSPHEIDFVFSVQEEVGIRGATTAAYGLDPDLGLAVDVTSNGDTPKGTKMDVHLGKGPAIKVRDAGMISDPPRGGLDDQDCPPSGDSLPVGGVGNGRNRCPCHPAHSVPAYRPAACLFPAATSTRLPRWSISTTYSMPCGC